MWSGFIFCLRPFCSHFLFSLYPARPACFPGTFKSKFGEGSCAPCPSNSRASARGADVCPCQSGFYRADSDPPESVCTSKSSCTTESTNRTKKIPRSSPPLEKGIKHNESFANTSRFAFFISFKVQPKREHPRSMFGAFVSGITTKRRCRHATADRILTEIYRYNLQLYSTLFSLLFTFKPLVVLLVAVDGRYSM